MSDGEANTDDPAERAVVLLETADIALAEHRFTDAFDDAREAAAIFVDVDGVDSPDGANALMTAAAALQARSRDDDLAVAARLYGQALEMLGGLGSDSGGPIDTLVLRARRGVGTILRMRGHYVDAQAAFADALEHAEAAFGIASAEAGFVCNDLGILGKFAGAFEEAHQHYARALRIVERTEGPRSAAAATLHHNLAGLAHSRRRSSEGVNSGRLSVEIRRELFGDDHIDVAADRANLGGLLMDLDEIDEAEACFEAARDVFERILGPEHVEVAIAWHNLAAVADARGDTSRAVDLYRRALESKARSLGDTHPSTLITAVNLGYLVDDVAEARSLFQRAIDGLADLVDDDDRTLAAARRGMAQRD